MTVSAPAFLRMADSIDPNALRGLGMDAYAGYDNGRWPDFLAIVAEEPPGTPLLDFTVFLQDTGTGGDFEPGDMPASDVVTYVNERHAAGVARPVVYASIAGEMIQIVANLHAANIPLSSVRLLSAHYGAGQHICGPTTCMLGAAATTQMDGTQWIDHATDGRGNWDESILLPNFFGSPTPTPPPTLEGSMLTKSVPFAGQPGHFGQINSLGDAYHWWQASPLTSWSDEPLNKFFGGDPVPEGFFKDARSIDIATPVVLTKDQLILRAEGADHFPYQNGQTAGEAWSGWTRQDGGPHG
jgi:hypothetical protein